jgi:hypothetical protein
VGAVVCAVIGTAESRHAKTTERQRTMYPSDPHYCNVAGCTVKPVRVTGGGRAMRPDKWSSHL